MDELIKSCKEGSSHRFHPSVLYALFANAVEFDSSFKGIQEGYIAENFEVAAAQIVLKEDPAGSHFTFSPYWSEALAHLAGFMVQGNPAKSPRTTFIVMGFDSVEQTADFEPGKEYLTYTRIRRWEERTAFCDAYIFDPVSTKLVMQCRNLRYMELPRVTWRHILEGGHAGKPKDNSSTSRSHVPATKEVKEENVELVEQQTGRTVLEKEATISAVVLDLILDTIAKSTGTDPSEFTEDAQLSDLGVDSIMAIEIVSAVKAKSAIDLAATFVFDYPTIGALCSEFGAAPASEEASNTRVSSKSSSTERSTPGNVFTPESVSSAGSGATDVDSSFATPDDTVVTKRQPIPPKVNVNDTSPQPTVRITLLQGRPGPDKTPFYLMADGTGSIATYIHLPSFKSKMPVYGIDSPFLRCPSRLTSEIGIPGVAKLIVDALVKANPHGPLSIGGFSAGCHVAYEVCRQLGAAGRRVDGLLIIDLYAPRPTQLDESAIHEEAKAGVAIFGAAVAKDGLWSSTASVQQDHLHAYFAAMRMYDPSPMLAEERPSRTAVIWAEKGLVNRVVDDPKLMQMLADNGIPTEAYPGFIENPRLSPMACLVPDKKKADLGPNGWDRYVGDILTLSVDSDHLDLPMPAHVHRLHEQLEHAFTYFSSSS